MIYLPVEENGFGFPYPILLSWLHMLSASVLTRVLKLVRPDLLPAAVKNPVTYEQWATRIAPVAVFFAICLGFGNMAYLHISVSYIQMLKSAGPIAVYLVAVLFRIEEFKLTQLLIISLISFGVGGASAGESRFSMLGFMLQLVAFVADAFRVVSLKLWLSSKGLKLDTLSGLYYYAPVALLALTPAIYFF